MPSSATVYYLGRDSHQVSDPVREGSFSLLRPLDPPWLAWIQDLPFHAIPLLMQLWIQVLDQLFTSMTSARPAEPHFPLF